MKKQHWIAFDYTANVSEVVDNVIEEVNDILKPKGLKIADCVLEECTEHDPDEDGDCRKCHWVGDGTLIELELEEVDNDE
tara:strand:+ start:611 stop:850 length:240 start_codon:yes stop_codon:yes gene_type:complete